MRLFSGKYYSVIANNYYGEKSGSNDGKKNVWK